MSIVIYLSSSFVTRVEALSCFAAILILWILLFPQPWNSALPIRQPNLRSSDHLLLNKLLSPSHPGQQVAPQIASCFFSTDKAAGSWGMATIYTGELRSEIFCTHNNLFFVQTGFKIEWSCRKREMFSSFFSSPHVSASPYDKALIIFLLWLWMSRDGPAIKVGAICQVSQGSLCNFQNRIAGTGHPSVCVLQNITVTIIWGLCTFRN